MQRSKIAFAERTKAIPRQSFSRANTRGRDILPIQNPLEFVRPKRVFLVKPEENPIRHAGLARTGAAAKLSRGAEKAAGSA
jgi:hypothetical protein